MGRKSTGKSRSIFSQHDGWGGGGVRVRCMSFPVDILGKAFSGSFRFSRNDTNGRDHIEQSLNHWAIQVGSISEAITGTRRSFYSVCNWGREEEL